MSRFFKIAASACFIAVFCTSCTTSRVIGDTRTPEVEVESSGIIWVGERQVQVGKIGKALKSAGFSVEKEVKVLVTDKGYRSLMQAISADLVMSGFKRPVFITNKITQSTTRK